MAELLTHNVLSSASSGQGQWLWGVPQKVLYQFRVDAASQKEGSASVPEIVPANRGETRALEERLEAAVDYVLSVQRGAFTCGENRPIAFAHWSHPSVAACHHYDARNLANVRRGGFRWHA